jgi:putative FmdB family regulatory protein
MPIYEYQCQKCHHHLEALQKISDKPLRECPECGKHTLTRLMSAPMFRLSGSGWYETDFKSDKEQKRNLTGKDEAPAVEASPDKGEKKVEEKPAAKPEPEAPRQGGSMTKAAPAAVAKTRTAVKKPAAKKPAARKPAARKPTRKR